MTDQKDQKDRTGRSGQTDHGGGVHSIKVPIPDNPLGHTLVYVMDTDRGPVLIDTGWDDPASYDALAGGLTAIGTSIADIHGVLVTHAHPDHHGLSGQVREASGAWIAMHAADIDVVRRIRRADPVAWLGLLIDGLDAAGAPEEHLGPMREARAARAEGNRMRTLPGLRSALPDREIVPGERLPLAGRRLRAVWTPGHTPGHVCLYDEDGRRLFSGDHLLPEVTPHIGLYEDPEDATVTDPLGDYLDSLERIGRLEVAEVLPAHQYAFADASGRVAELLAHHADRLAALRALLADAPLTLWQLTELMEWNRPWAQIPHGSRNIAVSEAEAHLRRLVKAGLAEAVPGTDPVTYSAV